jgi:RNA polymerase sigma factor (sigma-70 family)
MLRSRGNHARKQNGEAFACRASLDAFEEQKPYTILVPNFLCGFRRAGCYRLKMTSDGELLRRYTETNSEDAFAELARRHLDLVYSAALRQVNGDAHLAQEVAQSVFADLARKAASLVGRQALAGWLYTGAHYAAAKAVRTEQRRHTREQEAHAMQELLHDPGSNPDWETLRPVLDTAMHELNEADREVILLRYFENRPHADIGEQFGLSENAARMRVERALERLRAEFHRRGVTTTAVALSTAVSANAVSVGPAGLAATLSTAALTGTTLTTAATATATKAIAMTTLQKTLITATLIAAVGTGIYEARQASTLRTEVQTLRQQQALLAEQLRRERDGATNRLASLADEIARMKNDSVELLKLRGEVSRLRNDSHELADLKTAKAQEEKAPPTSTARTMSDRVVQLQQRLNQNPNESIPEIQFATPVHWLNSIDFKLETEDDYRRASYLLRNQAQNRFSVLIKEALGKYSQAHNGQFPSDLSQLQSWCDPAVGNALIQLYEIVPASVVKDSHVDGDWIITRKVRANPESTLRLATFMGGSAWYNSDSRD